MMDAPVSLIDLLKRRWLIVPDRVDVIFHPCDWHFRLGRWFIAVSATAAYRNGELSSSWLAFRIPFRAGELERR